MEKKEARACMENKFEHGEKKEKKETTNENEEGRNFFYSRNKYENLN